MLPVFMSTKEPSFLGSDRALWSGEIDWLQFGQFLSPHIVDTGLRDSWNIKTHEHSE